MGNRISLYPWISPLWISKPDALLDTFYKEQLKTCVKQWYSYLRVRAEQLLGASGEALLLHGEASSAASAVAGQHRAGAVHIPLRRHAVHLHLEAQRATHLIATVDGIVPKAGLGGI